MRRLLVLLGNVLLALSVLGALALVVGVPEPLAAPVANTPVLDDLVAAPPVQDTSPAVTPPAPPHTDRSATVPASPTQAGGASEDVATPAPERRPITHVTMTHIGLDADVVPSTFTEEDGGMTWSVPAFKAGHAEGTAGAGQPGNAVLFGHVTSVHSGDVFANLDQAEVGDMVQIFSGQQEFDYRVVDTRWVDRKDSSVLQPTPTPSVSLITCEGVWVPLIWDYNGRRVVRAELQPSPDAGAAPSSDE